jgi:hypothetical protein
MEIGDETEDRSIVACSSVFLCICGRLRNGTHIWGFNGPNPKAVKLADRNWDSFNKAQLEKLLNTYGKNSASYNPAKPPYAYSIGITPWFSSISRKRCLFINLKICVIQ